MRLCCQCMSTHSFSPPFACLLSSLDPKPHRIPHFLSFCQTPLDLHSLFSPPGETKRLVAFPSLLVRQEAKDRQGCGSAKSPPRTTAPFPFCLILLNSALQPCYDKIHMHTLAVSAGKRMHHQRGSILTSWLVKTMGEADEARTWWLMGTAAAIRDSVWVKK